jgi:hypothetical protein
VPFADHNILWLGGAMLLAFHKMWENSLVPVLDTSGDSEQNHKSVSPVQAFPQPVE